MKRKTQPIIAAVSFALILSACGGGGAPDGSQTGTSDNPAGLTEEQLRNGIGPITEVTLGPIDEALVAKGSELFTVKCTACHKLEDRYIGPPLGDVTTRRTPEFVMNMILNPEEMTQKHPEARKLLAEYLAPMANQSLTEEEARAILEYLREAAPEVPPADSTM